MFQRSERVSDDELFSSVVHLLTGRARLWYRSWFDTFECWNDLVAAMKIEFLPPKYDYKLLTTISNRRQKSSETFAEYLNAMQSQFQHLSIPVNEQHKLSIIEENMLPKYAIATSAIEVTRLDQLSNICRRVDYAHSKSHNSTPSDRFVEQRQGFRSNSARYREVHELGVSQQQGGLRADAMASTMDGQPSQQVSANSGAPHTDNEVLEIRNDRSNVDVSRRECFNCLQMGHTFSTCSQPRNGQFCYRCGSRNVTTFTCQICTKNGDPGSVSREGGLNFRNQ